MASENVNFKVITGTALYNANGKAAQYLRDEVFDIWNPNEVDDLFLADPDYVKALDGSVIAFVDHEDKTGQRLFVLQDDFHEGHVSVLDWWLNSAKEDEIEVPNTWQSWNEQVKSGIAYRGGIGYAYDIYCKENL
jgi:hypothetical protein